MIVVVLLVGQTFLVTNLGMSQGADQTHRPVARNPILTFERFTTDDGLPSLNTRQILQDSQGFMWFATADGLSRYDGYEFETYLPNPDDPNSISHNNAYSVLEDSQQDLWIGHLNGGLNHFDRTTERFTVYRHDPKDPNSLSHDTVYALYEDKEGTLWVGTASGLNLFIPDSGEFVRYQHAPTDPTSLSHNQVWTIAEDNTGQLWVGTEDGLNRFEPDTKQFIHYKHDPQDNASISSNKVRWITNDREGGLWIGTYEGGLNQWNSDTKGFTQYRAEPSNPNSLSHDDIYTLHLDRQGIVWIGTYGGGVTAFDPSRHRFIRHRFDPYDDQSVGSDTINHIFQDRNGAIWFSSFTGGISKLDPDATKFDLYRHRPNDPLSLSHNFTWDIAEAPDGILWIGSVGGGLIYLDPETGRFGKYRHDPHEPNSLMSDVVFGVHVSRAGIVWAATGNGLERLNPEAKQFTHFRTNPHTGRSFGATQVADVFEDSRGFIWFVPDGSGVNTYDPSTGQFTFYPYDPNDPSSPRPATVSSISEDSHGFVWIATFGAGAMKFDPASERFTVYQHDPQNPNSLMHDQMGKIYETSDGLLWMTTGAGVSKFDPVNERFTHYRMNDGLPTVDIIGVVEDDQGYIWFGTFGGGLSRFDPRTETFRNYDESDGVQPGGAFLRGSLKSRSGKLYFTGNNGVNAFDPKLLSDNPVAPPVVLTGFSLFNSPVPIGGEDALLAQSITDTETLTLSYDQSVFSFEFAALNYRHPKKNQFAYMLQGFDQDWNSVDSSRRFATYTNLDPGSYTFRVKASNNDGVWNEEGTSLTITVTPPWWQTFWFRGMLGVLVSGAIVGAFVVQRQSALRRERHLETQVAERTHELKLAKNTAEAANEAKSIFLANMSHELRTPLNAVLGFSEIMDRDTDVSPKQQENLRIINRSGQHLLGLINDVLDMSKIESGHVELDPEQVDLHRLLSDIRDVFRVRAASQDLEFWFELNPIVPRYAVVDGGKLRQVLMNLLGNAINFTETGQVRLVVDAEALPENHWQLRVEVHDTGVGIPPKKIGAIFEPFMQVGHSPQNNQGTGLGLAISRQFIRLMDGDITVDSIPGHGSVFRFAIPILAVDSLEAAHGGDAHGKQIVGLEANQPQWRILIVEDVAENRLLLRRLLESVGFIVREAWDGQEGIQVFQDWQPHLIWMDRRMPEMDGLTATRHIRKLPGGDQVKIIVISASVFKDQRPAVLEAGADDFVRKPYQSQMIFDCMAKHLGIRYQYQVSEPEPKESPPLAVTLSPKSLASLPEELRQELHRAALSLNPDSIIRSIDRIRVVDPEVAQALMELTKEFQFDRILELLDHDPGQRE